ncbi:hypothetical protein PVAND_001264 [Polypedilum vanderplanki]|uniref:Histone-lysine N-methyltransferase n=1 Tax=Polypedilum vanderplanki TaxID=319348 RepID=A0A9J6BNQ6_POLVA|nr:hypothetical protein PVAND_001264 [Polypedilum vanderplanki]
MEQNSKLGSIIKFRSRNEFNFGIIHEILKDRMKIITIDKDPKYKILKNSSIEFIGDNVTFIDELHKLYYDLPKNERLKLIHFQKNLLPHDITVESYIGRTILQKKILLILKNNNKEISLDIDENDLNFEKIEKNIMVSNVTFKKNQNSLIECDCTPYDDEPCGPNSYCINRNDGFECSKNCAAGQKCQNKKLSNNETPQLGLFDTKTRGIGVKALEEIQKDNFIIEYIGEIIDEKEKNERLKKFPKVSYIYTLTKSVFIDAHFKSNFSRFVNHSCEPNAYTRIIFVNGFPRLGIYALRTIKKNEEVLIDYGWGEGNELGIVCLCGSSKCRKNI